MMVASPSKAQPPSAQHQLPTRARTKGLPLPRPGTWFGTPAAKKAGRRADDDFVMVSPHAESSAMASSSPAEESPTPAARVSHDDDNDEDSPIRRVPGQSRSLSLGRPSLGKCSVDQGAEVFMAPPSKRRDENDWMRRPRNEPSIDSSPPPPPTPIHAHYSHQTPALPPPPQPRFPSIRNSHSHELSTASSSKSVRFDQPRPRATTDAERVRVLGQKKAVSLDNINIDAGAELFGDGFGVPIGSRTRKATSAHSLSSHGTLSGLPRHRRVKSGDAEQPTNMISRSFGHKSGLALSLSPGLPAFSTSDSSLSSFSTANLTPPASTFSPAEPPIFEDVKPLASAFEPQSATVSRKFKPRDSGVGLEDECTKVDSIVPPPSVSRPKLLKRPSEPSELDIETPGFGPGMASGWPSAGSLGFDFLGQATSQLVSQAAAEASMDDKPHMPDTPVKKQAFTHAGSAARNLPPATVVKTAHLGSARTSKEVLHLTLTTSSSPTAMEMDEQSPTVHAMIGKGRPSVPSGSRVGMLRRQSSGAASSSESEEGTPTKSGTSGDRNLLGAGPASLITPSPSPKLAAHTSLPRTSTLQAGSAANLMPRLSLPAIQAPKLGRKLNHRQSHPLPRPTQAEDDIFEQRFITLEPLGKGAFSSVVKVQERLGDGVYAVKKAIGVFEGVKDRLRHLEEVDILRHLSRTPHPHVISFVDAWEQNRQLFIQTELCLGSLAFFLEEYGRVVPRLDEARVWKIIRELSDGLHHIHSNGVIHFDIKPANILISSIGDLKIGDFGLASRWPRVNPVEILRGSGLGGALGMGAGARVDKLEREGDRVYMPPEMLRGEFTMAADIFSFGLVSLEVATNICMPDGGAPWHALRQNDYSIVDLSPLSPALIDLITKCMHSEPALRPTIEHIVTHPVVQRARNGKPALAPEDELWLVEVLAGGLAIAPRINDGDVEMRDA